MIGAQSFEQPPNTFPANDTETNLENSYLDTNHLTEMLLFLSELRQDDSIAYNRSNIDKRQANIKDAKNEELYQWINKSDQAHWQTHPSFYHALIAELKLRKLIPTE